MKRFIIVAALVVLGVGAASITMVSASADENHDFTVIEHDANFKFSHLPPGPGDTLVVGYNEAAYRQFLEI